MACGREDGARRKGGATETLQALASIERLLDAGRAEEALRAAESLSKTAPDEALVAEMLGRARLAAHRPADEIADAYAAASALAPESPGLHGVAGMTAAQAGRIEQAMAQLREAERLEPGNPQHALMQARLLLARPNAPAALEAAERAHRLAPNDPTVIAWTALCHLATGSRGQALQLARAALAAGTPSPELRVEVADMLVQAGSADEAMAAIDPLLRATGTTAALLESVARCQSSAGRHADAAATWQRLASAPTQPWRPCLMAGECLIDAGSTQAAREWIARAAERGAPPAELARVEARLRDAVSGSSGPRPPAAAPPS